MTFGYKKINTTPAENLQGASETVKKLKLKPSCEADVKSLYKKRTKSTNLKFNRKI